MITNYSWFSISLLINFMDIVMLYTIVHNFGGHELSLSKKRLMRDLLIAVGHGVILGSISYYDRAGWIYQGLVYSSLFVLTMLYTKRKLGDSIILVAALFLFVSVVQAVFFYPLTLLPNLSNESLTLIGHALTMLMIVSLCLKIKFHNMFLLIQQKLYLKIIIFLLTLIFILVMNISGFDSESILEQAFVTGSLIFTVSAGIVMTFISAQKKIDYSTDKYHDVVNRFNGLYLSIMSEDSMDMLKEQAQEIKEYLTDRKVLEPIIAGDHGKNLEILLYEKLAQKEKDNDLILDIDYFSSHEKVSFTQLALMLGILFDNALDHGEDKPIFVELNVSQRIFELTVKNSCKEKSDKVLKKMFKKGYTTKESVGNGRGLYNLEQEVKKHQGSVFNGIIKTDCSYDAEYESYYLTIKIDISHKSLKFSTSAGEE